MDSTRHLIHLAPADQPHSVHQITRRLLPAYTVDDGMVQPAGWHPVEPAQYEYVRRR